jgi:hypothetical protein
VAHGIRQCGALCSERRAKQVEKLQEIFSAGYGIDSSSRECKMGCKAVFRNLLIVPARGRASVAHLVPPAGKYNTKPPLWRFYKLVDLVSENWNQLHVWIFESSKAILNAKPA